MVIGLLRRLSTQAALIEDLQRKVDHLEKSTAALQADNLMLLFKLKAMPVEIEQDINRKMIASIKAYRNKEDDDSDDDEDYEYEDWNHYERDLFKYDSE